MNKDIKLFLDDGVVTTSISTDDLRLIRDKLRESEKAIKDNPELRDKYIKRRTQMLERAKEKMKSMGAESGKLDYVDYLIANPEI